MSYTSPVNNTFSKKILLSLFVFTIVLVIIRIIFLQNELTQIKQLFIHEQDKKANQIANDIYDKIKTSYETIRTVSLLPEVRSLEQEGQTLSPATTNAIIQLYNNVFYSFQLSKIQIISKDFDHQKINPLTQKEELPIALFNNFGAIQHSDKNEASIIAKNEDCEYALYKNQVLHLKNYYPKNLLSKLTIPMISGHELTICNNSELSNDRQSKDQKESLLGIALTVPKYDQSGNFNGAVTALFKTNIIKSFLPLNDYGLINLQYNNKIVNSPSKDWLESVPFFENGFKNKNLIYSKMIPIKTMDQHEWALWVAVPNTVFYNSEKYKNTFGHFYIELLFCFFIVLFFFYFQLKILKYSIAFYENNKELDQYKLRLEKGNMLLNILSHNIANTLWAIKSCNDYLNKNKKTLFEVNIIKKTEETVNKMMIATDLAINVFEHVNEIKSSKDGELKLKLKLEPTHIDEIVKITLIIFESSLLKKNIKLTLKNYTGETLFSCHKTSFCNSVFNNLISNAINFSPVNSEIIIRTMIEGTHFEIFIQDFGAGIPKEISKMLFEKNKTNTRKGTTGESGSGFGISLAKSYLEYSGARLSFITNTTGETGTTFKISLKIAHEQERAI